MHIPNATPHAGLDSEFPWFGDASLADSRADRIAEAVALVALLFSLGIGLVIALLPVSAGATPAATAHRAVTTLSASPAFPTSASQGQSAE